MPRFVILRHETTSSHAHPSHWDVMLEFGGVLKTWAVFQSLLDEVEVSGLHLPDHRIAYLDYEGPVSGDRGQVTRWDAGRYRLISQTSDCWVVDLRGTRLRGRLRMNRKSPGLEC